MRFWPRSPCSDEYKVTRGPTSTRTKFRTRTHLIYDNRCICMSRNVACGEHSLRATVLQSYVDARPCIQCNPKTLSPKTLKARCICLFVYSFVYSCIHSYIHSSIHVFIYLYTHIYEYLRVRSLRYTYVY